MRLDRRAESTGGRGRTLWRVALPTAGAFLAAAVLPTAAAEANHPARNGLIAFSKKVTCDRAGFCFYSVETIGPRGKGRRRLSCGQGTRKFCSDAYPRFSPNGRLLAIGTDDFDEDFVSVRRVGGRVRRTYSLGTSLVDLAWSPSGRRIAFNEFTRISFLDLTTGSVKPYRRTPDGEDVTWSRDGRLAWTSFSAGDIFVTDRSRRRVRRIRLFAASEPRFSPHGTKIAYLGHNGAYVIGIRGRSRPRFIGRCETQETEVAWSPDGREIACHKDAPAGGLIAYNVRTRQRRTIVRVGFPFSIDWQRRPE